MAPKGSKSSRRISSKTSLAKAVELIASNQFRDETKKPARPYFKVDPAAAKIMIRVTANNPVQAWPVLLGCDAMSLYGSQIPLAFEGYCLGDYNRFIEQVANRHEDIVRWVDKQRSLKEGSS